MMQDHIPAAHRPSSRKSINLYAGGNETGKNSTAGLAFEYDYVMVFDFCLAPGEDPKTAKPRHQSGECRAIIVTMLEAGLEIFPYESIQSDELYVLIRAPLKILQNFADKSKFTLPLCEKAVREFFESQEADYVDYKLTARTAPEWSHFHFLPSSKDESGTAKKQEVDFSKEGERLSKKILEHRINSKINPCVIAQDPAVEDGDGNAYSPYEHIFAKYEIEFPQRLYKHSGPFDSKQGKNAFELEGEPYDPLHEPFGHLFNNKQRLMLLDYLLKGPTSEGGCGLQLNHLRKQGHIRSFFPLHDREEKKKILNASLAITAMPWTQPVQELRDYYGEKVAMYYAFTGHYSLWLIAPALVGILVQLVVFGTGDFSHPILVFFGILVAAWSMLMLENWKRKEKRQALEWGMTGFESKEPILPEFYGYKVASPVNGVDMLYFPEPVKRDNLAASGSVVAVFMMLVIGVVISIYVLRFEIPSISQNKHDPNFTVGLQASLTASVLNTVQITLFNYFYGIIAIKMTDSENQRTNTLYADSLITKMFVFQFINSNASFFFIAFIAQYVQNPEPGKLNTLGQCGFSNCMMPLALNLGIIFGTRLTVNNIADFAYAYYAYKTKKTEETMGVSEEKLAKITPAEEDDLLMEYDTTLEGILCFADSTIQFGYCTLFIVALPISMFFALVSNYVALKCQSYKTLNFYQRPVPEGAEDLGRWDSIYYLLAYIAVLTNGGIICFTMDVLGPADTHVSDATSRASFSSIGRIWVFAGFVATMFALLAILQSVIPDVPPEVELQLQRMDFIVSKIIMREPDEVEQDHTEATFSVWIDPLDPVVNRRNPNAKNHARDQIKSFDSNKFARAAASGGGGGGLSAQEESAASRSSIALSHGSSSKKDDDGNDGLNCCDSCLISCFKCSNACRCANTGNSVISQQPFVTQTKRLRGDDVPKVPTLKYPDSMQKRDLPRCLEHTALLKFTVERLGDGQGANDDEAHFSDFLKAKKKIRAKEAADRAVDAVTRAASASGSASFKADVAAAVRFATPLEESSDDASQNVSFTYANSRANSMDVGGGGGEGSFLRVSDSSSFKA